MKRRAPPSAQRGVALIALLVMILLAGGYAFYRGSNFGGNQYQERDTVLQRLARAKEAVIAYAVNDATRPGRLLCPDQIGDGLSPLFVLDECASYGGLLPWKTLDLPDHTDAQGSSFRYHLSPAFGGQNPDIALNSVTATTLRLDVAAGSDSNDIAAVIIAPRGAPDARNADGNEYFYNHDRTNELSTAEDNDIIIAITRQELMAAVEQRIANELRTCLDQHSNSPDNLQKTYPWPAPLSNAIYKGATKSLFGMVPDTQAGNPEMALKDSIAKLTAIRTTLTNAATVDDQLAATYQLQEQAAYARALFDRQYLSAVDLSEKASKAKTDFTTLDATIVAVTKTAGTFATQGNILSGAIDSALPSLLALIDTLKNTGFDLFLMELQLRNPELKTRIDTATAAPTKTNFDRLITPVNRFKNNQFEYSWTQNTVVDGTISTSLSLADSAATAINAARASTLAPLTDLALADANALYDANRQIESTILGYRVNVDTAEISATATGIISALTATGNELLLQRLASAKTLVTSISTASVTINTARAASISTLDSAFTQASTGTDQAQIRTTAEAAASQLNALSLVLGANGDNVALETLQSVAISLATSVQNPPPDVTTARSLRDPTKTVLYWSDTAISQAADLARLARKGISSQEDSDKSAYTAARKLMDSVDGNFGTIALLDQSRKTATAENTALAQAALTKTLSNLNDLLNAATTLDNALETGIAEAAAPPIWYGQACQFLRPPSGRSTWWNTNEWKRLFFYQISDRIRPPSGVLSVNGSGNYRAVAIAASKALPVIQDRNVREVKNYLEKINADNSRNGDAQSPSTRFVSETVSPTFNDRLAY